MPKTFGSAMTELFERYIDETGDTEADLRTVGAWAVSEGHYDIPNEAKISRFCRELRDALRGTTHVSPSGRKMRTYQCAKRVVKDEEGNDVQRFLWADVRNAAPTFVIESFRERYHQCEADIESLKSDVETWNKDYRPEDFDPIAFNWTFDSEP